MLRGLPPEVLEAMIESGFDPAMLTGAGASAMETITGGVMCCGVGLVIAAVIGAIGGVVFAAVKSE